MAGQEPKYEIYEGYLDDHEEEMKKGEPFIVEVRDLETFERIVARAIVSREPNAIEGGVPLRIRNIYDEIENKLGTIKIVEILDDEEYQPQRSERSLRIPVRGRGIGMMKREEKL